jgi:hypothetical protein
MALTPARHRRYPQLPRRRARWPGRCPMRRRDVLLSLVPQTRLPEVPHRADGEWLERCRGEMLPVPYFHIPITVPKNCASARLSSDYWASTLHG